MNIQNYLIFSYLKIKNINKWSSINEGNRWSAQNQRWLQSGNMDVRGDISITRSNSRGWLCRSVQKLRTIQVRVNFVILHHFIFLIKTSFSCFKLWCLIGDPFRSNKEMIKESSKPIPGSSDIQFHTQYSQSFWTQCMACLWKQHWSYWRNPPYTAVRFLFTTFIALMFGTIFWDMGSKR